MIKSSKEVGNLEQIFDEPKPLIGTVHCHPYPGTPEYEGEPVKEIIDHAVEEARRYETGGMDGVIVENEGDHPFLRPKDINYETVSIMSVVARNVRKEVAVPVGINILANAAMPSLAAAKASNSSFIRVNQWVNAYVANEGIVQGNSAKVLRYRKNISAEDIKIFADVHVKHGAHAIVEDRPVREQARDVEFFDADIAIATGNRTGDATPVEEIQKIKAGTDLPVIIGSGLSAENSGKLMQEADGAIVGSSLKSNGKWWGNVEVERVKELVARVENIRQNG